MSKRKNKGGPLISYNISSEDWKKVVEPFTKKHEERMLGIKVCKYFLPWLLGRKNIK